MLNVSLDRQWWEPTLGLWKDWSSSENRFQLQTSKRWRLSRQNPGGQSDMEAPACRKTPVYVLCPTKPPKYLSLKKVPEMMKNPITGSPYMSTNHVWPGKSQTWEPEACRGSSVYTVCPSSGARGQVVQLQDVLNHQTLNPSLNT